MVETNPIQTMNKKIRILSIDGGGIRGIIPGMILVALEKKLQEKSGNPNARIPDYFDFVAGTSTGGILGCALFYPEASGSNKAKYQAQDAVNLYLKNGSMIFKRTFWHNLRSLWGLLSYKFPTTNLEKALEQYLGEERLSSLLKPSAISSYYIADAQPFFFKQHRAKTSLDYDYLIKDVARGTSAAPTYFESADVKSLQNNTYTLIDGGVYVNNPSLCAYAEARTMTYDQLRPDVSDSAENVKNKRPSADDMVIFSLGTASSAQKYSYKEIKNWGIISWIKPLIGVMMSGVSQNVDYQLREIFKTTSTPDNYLRIEPNIYEANPAMDDGTPGNLQRLKEAGEKNAQIYNKELDRMADLLIFHHPE